MARYDPLRAIRTLLPGGEDRRTEARDPTLREQRSPAAATTPLSYNGVGRPMVPSWDAASSVRLAYYANIFVYRCVQVRAQCVARLPVRVGADPDKPADFNTKSPLLKFLTANTALGWRNLIVTSSAQYDVTGRFGWEVERDTLGVPLRPWPLISAYLDPIPSTGGEDYWERFEYRTRNPKGDQVKKLTREQTFYAWRPSLEDPRQPESLLQAMRLNVSAAVMQDRYTYAFLLNDARPASLVVAQAFASEDEFAAFKRQWSGEFGGPDNAGKPVFVEADGGDEGPADASKWIAIQPLGLTQRDAQALQMYERELKTITIGFGVPVSKLGDASGRTFDNAGQEDRMFWGETMLPHLADLADQVNRILAPRFGSDVLWFDTSKVEALRPPSRFQVVNLSDLVDKVVTVNEARAEVGLPALDGYGELGALVARPTPAIPAPEVVSATEDASGAGRAAGSFTLTQPASPPTRTPEAAAGPGGSDVQPGGHVGKAAAARIVPGPAGAAPPAGRGTRHPDPAEAPEVRRTRVWNAADQRVRALEGRFERQMRTLFGRQLTRTLERMGGKRGRQQLERAGGEARDVAGNWFDPSFWETETRDVVEAFYEAVTLAAGFRVSDDFGIAFDVEAPGSRAFIALRSNQLAGQVTQTTYLAIQDALVEGVDAGEGIDDLADRVRGVFDQADQSRARTIARTETISAYNGAGTMLALDHPDLIGGAEWIATPDTRTRDDHADADGQTIRLGARFWVGGVGMDYPGDPAAPPDQVVNCRCAVGFISADEMAERSAGRRVELRSALAVLGMVGAGLLDPDQVPRALEVAA